MENPSRYNGTSLAQLSSPFKQRRSGYEPSDTESEWHETPWEELNRKNAAPGSERPKTLSRLNRNTSPLKLEKRHFSPPKVSPIRRRSSSKSPYKLRQDAGEVLSPISGVEINRNVSPFSTSERRRHISPHVTGREDHTPDDDELISSSRKQNRKLGGKNLDSEDKNVNNSQLHEVTRVSERLNYTRRSASTPKFRVTEDRYSKSGNSEQKGNSRTPSPLSRNLIRKQREAARTQAPAASEINEIVANAKLSRFPTTDPSKFESTDSIAPGDIFFSNDFTAVASRNNVLPLNNGFQSRFTPNHKVLTERDSFSHQRSKTNGNTEHNIKRIANDFLSRKRTTSGSAISRQSSGKTSTGSSKMSDASGKTTESLKIFTANRRKTQAEAWFSCMRKGPCRTSTSPESRALNEASYIEKAFVVENLRQFWADKHRPGSLNGFSCHKQEAQLLKQLASHETCPHILFKGPSGSGKKALTMAFLREIFGDASWNVSHDLRYFHIQENRPMKVAVPLTSSAHHVELNVNLEPNARYALMSLVKEISNSYAVAPEISNVNFKANYKVIVLYDVDKAPENVQHMIKWIMDCYMDSCKLILCCEDDQDILEHVKSRCKVIKVDGPVTHEIMEVLIQIARKEDFDLSMNFAAEIATKSKQNLRKAIMALEACRAHNYPFVDDQPIPLGWEEILVELASEILADPSPKRLFLIRGKFQKLLVDFVHPQLILQKLVEQFLKSIDGSLKRELYYWHAYYAKRLPTGTSALLKLEEFVAKFMSIYRKSIGRTHRQST